MATIAGSKSSQTSRVRKILAATAADQSCFVYIGSDVSSGSNPIGAVRQDTEREVANQENKKRNPTRWQLAAAIRVPLESCSLIQQGISERDCFKRKESAAMLVEAFPPA